MPRMFLLCGDIAAGKSTFAAIFARLHKLRRISIDDCYAFYNGTDTCRENKFEAWQLFFKLIHEAYKLGQDVIVDTNAPYVSDRQEFLNWFPEYDEHTLICIRSDIETMKERNARRNRKVPSEVIERLYKEFEMPTYDEPGGRSDWDNIYWFTSNSDKFELAEIIRRNYNLKEYPVEQDFLYEIIKKGMLNESLLR